MSRLIGLPEERWSLARAVDALGESARQAGAPGLVWLAGLLYPSLSLGLGAGWESWLLGPIRRRMSGADALGARGLAGFLDGVLEAALLGMLLLPVFLVFFRLMVGLARISAPGAWEAACEDRRAPPLRAAWRAGKGLTFACLGLWLQLAFMMLCAIAVSFGPAVVMDRLLGGVEPSGAGILLFGLFVGPFVASLVLYTAVLSVLLQLALHSLIQNRRGVGSAMIHAWRIARHDPWATGRAVLVDLVLWVSVFALLIAVSIALGGTCVLMWLVPVAWIALYGFAGVTRAGYWSRAYRALGGLSPEDGVPGLQADGAASASSTAIGARVRTG